MYSMRNRTVLVLAIFSALLILYGVYLMVFTTHTDEGLSLIGVGVATSAVSLGTNRQREKNKQKG